jgi:hypothetical protein
MGFSASAGRHSGHAAKRSTISAPTSFTQLRWLPQSADRLLVPPGFSWHDPYPLLRDRTLHPQFVRDSRAESAMYFANALADDRAFRQAAAVDPLLHRDVRFRFELKTTLAGILAVVVFQGAFDIDRVSVVAFDQVAVVAVHRPDKIGNRGQQALEQTPAKSAGFLRQLQGKVRECATMTVTFADEQASITEQFPADFRRLNVLFYVRFLLRNNMNYRYKMPSIDSISALKSTLSVAGNPLTQCVLERLDRENSYTKTYQHSRWQLQSKQQLNAESREIARLATLAGIALEFSGDQATLAIGFG